jgi:hypothetical protein
MGMAPAQFTTSLASSSATPASDGLIT